MNDITPLLTKMFNRVSMFDFMELLLTLAKVDPMAAEEGLSVIILTSGWRRNKQEIC